MVGEAAGVSVCLLSWGTKAYLASKYRIRYRIGGENRWAWKHGTPDWVTLLRPWLELLGWLGLLGFIVCWLLHPVPVEAGQTSKCLHEPRQFRGGPALAGLWAKGMGVALRNSRRRNDESLLTS
jgi:hypothetical protein